MKFQVSWSKNWKNAIKILGILTKTFEILSRVSNKKFKKKFDENLN